MFSARDCQVFSSLLVSLAGIITAGRLYIRIRQLHRIEWTDSWNLIALVFLIALVAIENSYFPYAAQTSVWYDGEKARPADDIVIRGYKLALAEGWMLASTLASVKISLLLFYRSIFGSSRVFVRACWAVIGAVGLNYFISTLSLFWACGSPGNLFVIDKCITPDAKDTRRNIYITSCAFTLFTSVCIIVLPTYMLRGLDISMWQKTGLATIFAIAAGDITLEIPRTVYAINGASLTLMLIWNILQCCIAVIVCGLPTYRGIFALSASERGSVVSDDYYEPTRPSTGRRRDSIAFSDDSGSTYAEKSPGQGTPYTATSSKQQPVGCLPSHPYPFKCVIEGAGPPPMMWRPPGDETGVELDGGDIFGGVTKAEKKRRPYCHHCPPEFYEGPSSSDETVGYGHRPKMPPAPEKSFVPGSWNDWAASQKPAHFRWIAPDHVKDDYNHNSHIRNDSGFGSSGYGGGRDSLDRRAAEMRGSGQGGRPSGERARVSSDRERARFSGER